MRYVVRVATETEQTAKEQTAKYPQEKDRMKTIRRRKIEIEISKGREERKQTSKKARKRHTQQESTQIYADLKARKQREGV